MGTPSFAEGIPGPSAEQCPIFSLAKPEADRPLSTHARPILDLAEPELHETKQTRRLTVSARGDKDGTRELYAGRPGDIPYTSVALESVSASSASTPK